jgi:hypothetical protein
MHRPVQEDDKTQRERTDKEELGPSREGRHQAATVPIIKETMMSGCPCPKSPTSFHRSPARRSPIVVAIRRVVKAPARTNRCHCSARQTTTPNAISKRRARSETTKTRRNRSRSAGDRRGTKPPYGLGRSSRFRGGGRPPLFGLRWRSPRFPSSRRRSSAGRLLFSARRAVRSHHVHRTLHLSDHNESRRSDKRPDPGTAGLLPSAPGTSPENRNHRMAGRLHHRKPAPRSRH